MTSSRIGRPDHGLDEDGDLGSRCSLYRRLLELPAGGGPGLGTGPAPGWRDKRGDGDLLRSLVLSKGSAG
jgi:hypothetical protein